MFDAEIKRLRLSDQAWADEQSRRGDPPPSGAPCLVVVVDSGSAHAFCSCTPQTVLGTEAEGSPGVLTPGAPGLIAYNLGAGDPTGQTVLCTFADYRWVFRYD